MAYAIEIRVIELPRQIVARAAIADRQIFAAENGCRVCIRVRSKPGCNQCHGVIDPIGLAMENFDAIGRWRDMDLEARAPIDARTVLPSGRDVDGPIQLREALFGAGAAALLLLFTGIHNAWDAVTYHVFVKTRDNERQR